MKNLKRNKTSTFKIILAISLFPFILFAQENYLPYKFEQCLNLGSTYPLLEGNIFTKDEFIFIGKKLRKPPNYSEIFFCDNEGNFIDNILADHEHPKISSYLYVNDIDNDGLDELIVPFIGEKSIKFLLYDHNNGKTKISEIFKIRLTDKAPTQYHIVYSDINLNNSKENELLISINSIYPKIGSLRGVFAIDIVKKKLIWFYPTAEYCSGHSLLTFFNKYIIIASSSASNGVAFSNNTYFKINQTNGKYYPYSTAYTKIHSEILDTTAEDYSTDQTANLICIDKTGKKVWNKKFGDEFVWGTIAKNNKKIIYSPRHRFAKDTVRSKLFLINPINGNILKEKSIGSQRITIIYFTNQRIILNTQNGTLGIYNFNFDKLNTQPLHHTYLSNYFNSKKESFYLGYSLINNKHHTVLYDENFQLISKTISSSSGQIYLPHLNKFGISDNKNIYSIYKLTYIPWYLRISPAQLWRYSFITSLLIIILVFSWGYSHYKDSKLIKEQKIQLEKTTSELIRKEKLSVLGTIASSVAHELNSPLGAILNSSQRILQHGKLEEIDKENANLIKDATLSCKTIIEKFLSSSRPGSKITGVYLDEALSDWMRLFGKKYSANEINIITQIEEECLLYINSLEMRQIINNLLSNAKHQLLLSKIEKKVITITSVKKGNFCQITFEDNGGGFPKEILEHKFEAFHTTKKIGEGTGLGLWIIKKIIDEVNGKIDIMNSEKGAKIIIKISLFDKKK